MKPFRFAFASTLLVCLLHVVPAQAESLIPATDFSFDMGTRRQNWTHARWQVVGIPARQELVTLLLNNGSEARSGDIEFLPPLGTRFSEGGVKIGKPDWNRGVVEIDTLAPLSVTPERATLNILLPPGIPVVVTLALEGMVANDAPATVFEKQYFGDVLLRDITPEAPLTLTLAVPDPATAKRVWFRFVAERLRDDEAELVFNGSVIPLPAAVTPENTSYLRQVAIDPALLKTENTLELRMKDPNQAGFFLGIAGLRVEREVP